MPQRGVGEDRLRRGGGKAGTDQLMRVIIAIRMATTATDPIHIVLHHCFIVIGVLLLLSQIGSAIIYRSLSD